MCGESFRERRQKEGRVRQCPRVGDVRSSLWAIPAPQRGGGVVLALPLDFAHPPFHVFRGGITEDKKLLFTETDEEEEEDEEDEEEEEEDEEGKPNTLIAPVYLPSLSSPA